MFWRDLVGWLGNVLVVVAFIAMAASWGFALLRLTTAERLRTEEDPRALPRAERRRIHKRVVAATCSTAVTFVAAWALTPAAVGLPLAVSFGLSAAWLGWFLASSTGRWGLLAAPLAFVLGQMATDALDLPTFGSVVLIGMLLPLFLLFTHVASPGVRAATGSSAVYGGPPPKD